jgi:chromosome segregation ATPase
MAKALLSLFVVGGAHAAADGKNPLGEVVSLMNDLAAKVTKDGADEDKAYKEYFEWCDDVTKNQQNEITTFTSQKAKLEATIEELTANNEKHTTKIEELAAAVSTGKKDLADAKAIRESENKEFVATEKELVDAIDTLGRAVTILEREMQKNPAALAQMDSSDLQGVVAAMGAVVEAAGFASADKERLVALVQSKEDADNDDGALTLGAPAAANYKTHSTGILDVLADMQEKAETKLSELRKAEKTATHNYDMLHQSLTDQLATDNSDMAATKASKAADTESKAAAEGDLAATTADLKASSGELATAQRTCMQVAVDHDNTVRARNEELKVIAQATKILQETTSGAVDQSYSFLQLGSGMSTGADLARNEVVTLVKKLARQHHSAALAQLASRIAAVVRYGEASGDDPFAKVKSLISDMISKLEAEADSAATEKAYCDDELSKTELKRSELDEDIAKLSTKIDQAAARSAELKEEVKVLQEELATLEKEQGENEKWHQDTHAAYLVAKADLEKGLGGVRKALEVLRDYYAAGAAASALVQQPAAPEQHAASTGAGQSIIGILEVVESDFATSLSKEETEEADNQETYATLTQEYKITKTAKDQDEKYKTQEFTSLDKSISEWSSDKDTLSTELAAVMDYYGKLKDRCIAKPETYEERKSRREAEINGLKEALSILENETAFVQKTGKHHGRHMRGALRPGQ